LIIPGVGAASILLAIRLADMAPASAHSLAKATATITGVIVLAHWLGHSLFMPVDANQRLLNLDNRTGGRALRLCQTLGLLLAAEIGFEAIETDFAFSPEASAVLGGLIILVGSLLLWALASLILRARSIEAPASESRDRDGIRQTEFLKLLARLMQISALLAAIFAASGFVELAREALIPMIISIGLVGSAYFMFRVIMAAIGIVTGRDYADRDDDGSLLSIAVIALLSLALIPVLALTWGARTADIVEVWRLLVDGMEFGETRISLEAVIKLIVVFGVGMLLTRWLQKLLRTTVLPRTRIDIGGKTALVTGVGYVGLTLAALTAVSAAGLNLSNLAVVAGALSVGIGFGLQTMVSNFVSGIILLIERPIKEGDWIEVSSYSGIVRKIAVRSTRIETFDQHDVIVPNSELIAGIVKNMTLSSKSGRIMIPVGIGYGSDLEAARRIMMTVAANHRMVMKYPEPQVMFMGLGESSLDFELRCYLHDVGESISARSEMLFDIYVELGKAGIEIPFPQRDMRLRDIDRLVRAIEGRAAAPRESDQTDKIADADVQIARPGE
jgi:small-conductance mechanosensitive channel